MSLNAAVTSDGAEIGHAQWVQALAAGVPAEAAMNPILLKPTGDRASQVIVMGRPIGVRTAAEQLETANQLRPVVLEALADLRRRFDVVLCEGAGGAAEINLLDRDLANLPLAAAAELSAIVVGDIERGGVFASLYGTVALLPDELRRWVGGFIINRFRGDPSLLHRGCAELETRTGVPTLGVVPWLPGIDLDAEDSLALNRWDTTSHAEVALDVAVVRFPRVANFGDLDPLRLEPAVAVRWVDTVAALGRPQLVILPGSKATVDDLAWFRASGLADAVVASRAPVIAVCAGLQMAGVRIEDPLGIEGPPGTVDGLGWLPVVTQLEPDKVLDRPHGQALGEPGEEQRFAGYRIHHGRVHALPDAVRWLVAADGTAMGWRRGSVLGTTVHGVFDEDALRTAILRWASEESGVAMRHEPPLAFAAQRLARIDAIADTLEHHLDLNALFALIEGGP